MALARDWAALLAAHPYEALPERAIEHAQMLVASTIASAAFGSTLASSHAVLAAFAGTVATARLLQLSALQTTHALALTATSVGGIAAAANTSCIREYDVGNAPR